MLYVSIPESILDASGVDHGDDVVVEPREDGFRVRQVTYEVTDG